MISIGLLGCGRIGQVHARSIARLQGARLTAVADAVPAAAEALAETSGADIRQADAIIAAPDIDAIIIATPTSLHFDQIHAAAAAGKAIFCEKPIDLSSDRAAQCAAVVTTSGVPFFTAFNRRFDPGFSRLRSELADGAIGNVEMVIITSRDPSPPPVSYIKQSGGLFRDMMIHDFDMARFLLGEEPVSVHAVGSCLVDPTIGAAGDVDTAAVTLTTASGKICIINNSRRATYGYDQRVEVHGAAGMLRAANHLEHTVERAGADGFTSAPNKHFFLERYEAAYLAEMEAFLNAVSSGGTPSPSIQDGVAAQRIADAAALSLAEGRTVSL
ncbi:inositol 2-dehydrogenase [Meridianimarinicoccus aquatilis]|uniref:Inositol 2-dehydrogenase n=1 Tax=Meridianimarinicoccus aquatilis TaxID=2552766 RepID=A0A4V3BBG9_9RHOB|nr:inositol 2-dehydrogenase [Fluviibacterium aquatile]QIE43350.1 inositol 2-dehydrogenase [Rhodobacteraceae bacterium SC52]TDL87059.1 inositol 2-dehydrogenase [Fluviibacterium aquatile]